MPHGMRAGSTERNMRSGEEEFCPQTYEMQTLWLLVLHVLQMSTYFSVHRSRKSFHCVLPTVKAKLGMTCHCHVSESFRRNSRSFCDVRKTRSCLLLSSTSSDIMYQSHLRKRLVFANISTQQQDGGKFNPERDC